MTANKVRASSLDHQLSLWYGDSLSPFIYSISHMNYVLNAQICVVLRASLILDWPKCLFGVFVLWKNLKDSFGQPNSTCFPNWWGTRSCSSHFWPLWTTRHTKPLAILVNLLFQPGMTAFPIHRTNIPPRSKHKSDAVLSHKTFQASAARISGLILSNPMVVNFYFTGSIQSFSLDSFWII